MTDRVWWSEMEGVQSSSRNHPGDGLKKTNFVYLKFQLSSRALRDHDRPSMVVRNGRSSELFSESSWRRFEKDKFCVPRIPDYLEPLTSPAYIESLEPLTSPAYIESLEPLTSPAYIESMTDRVWWSEMEGVQSSS